MIGMELIANIEAGTSTQKNENTGKENFILIIWGARKKMIAQILIVR